MKFGYNWLSGFIGEVGSCGQTTTATDDRPCLYYKLSCQEVNILGIFSRTLKSYQDTHTLLLI